MKNKKLIVGISIYVILLLIVLLYFIVNLNLKNGVYFNIWVTKIIWFLIFLALFVIPIIFIVWKTLKQDIEKKLKIIIVPMYIFVLIVLSSVISLFIYSKEHSIRSIKSYEIKDNVLYVVKAEWLETCPWMYEYEMQNIFLMKYKDSYKTTNGSDFCSQNDYDSSKDLFEVLMSDENSCILEKKFQYRNKDGNLYDVYYNCIDYIKFGTSWNNYDLSEAIEKKIFSIEDFINFAIKESETADPYSEKDYLWDGGTGIYRNRAFTLIACNTLDGNKDLYIGNYLMEYDEKFCKN